MQEGYRFPSRKNNVTLLREQDAWVVRKAFADAAACEEETTRMEKAAGCGLSVPALVRREGSVLFYTYVDGQTALEYLESPGSLTARSGAREMWTAFADWITAFYNAMGCLIRDCQLRNYIFKTDTCTVTGLDFEGPVITDPAEGLGRLLAYIKTYRPAGTPEREEILRLLRARWLHAFAGRGLDDERLAAAEEKALQQLLEERRVSVAQRADKRV
jgi:hypothetical protein